jgi:hypothetical protein
MPILCQAQESAGASTRPPDGWFVYPESRLKTLDESTLRCFNYSRNEWRVTNQDGGVKITRRVEDTAEETLPALLKLQPGMPGETVKAGLRSVLHLNGNWLLAYDGGEWGGGLWLTNEDGSQTKRILNDNVRQMVPMNDGVLVLSGLAHLSIEFGNVFIFSNPSGMNISLQHAAHLDGPPSAYAKEPDGSVLFVTTYGLWRFAKSGELQILTYFPKWTRQQYPNSMALASDGAIFIGMRMFVLVLRADAGHYKEEWLLPKECRSFYLRQLDCVCKP